MRYTESLRLPLRAKLHSVGEQSVYKTFLPGLVGGNIKKVRMPLRSGNLKNEMNANSARD